MEQVKFNNKSNNNPFKGLKNCLEIQQNCGEIIDISQLNAAWNEVKKDLEKRKMFFSLLFSIGDITNRQHNIFKGKKKDNGGNSNREAFYKIVTWLWMNNREQFIKFMNAQLFNEYSCFDMLFRNRIQTTGKVITKIYHSYNDEEYKKVLLDYTYSIINGSNPFNKMLIAKFLTIPRTSKRQGHKMMRPETRQIMYEKKWFIEELSKMMGWETCYLKGYREWRKQYNGDLESVMFTTGKIKEFEKQDFIDWYGKLPALARSRVEKRVFNNPEDKWNKFKSWILDWKRFKEEKQEEQRILEEKIRQGAASEEDKLKLKEVQKEAKVTVGATNFKDLYEDILYENVDKLKLESFVNKVHLDYNTLVIIDDSGSMIGAPFSFASFLASVCLVKNPDDDARNLIGFFASHSHWHSFIDSTVRTTRNSIMRQRIAQTNAKPLVDPTLSFYDNYKRISDFCQSVFKGGSTNLSSVIKDLKPLIEENPDLLDSLKSYPVWTIISDGDLNSRVNPKKSFEQFFEDCEETLGFKPFVVLIDISEGRGLYPEKFEGLENFMYIPDNVALIEQFLTNFKDMDTMDVYASLQALYRSNRYELVRANTI